MSSAENRNRIAFTAIPARRPFVFDRVPVPAPVHVRRQDRASRVTLYQKSRISFLALDPTDFLSRSLRIVVS